MCGREGDRAGESCLTQDFKIGRLSTCLKAAVDRGASERELIRIRRTIWRARLRLAKQKRRRRL